MTLVIVWVMCGIAVCWLALAAMRVSGRESEVERIAIEEIDQPRKYRADKRNATVAAMERLE